MLDGIKRLLGMHVHSWTPWSEPYSKSYERRVPVTREEIVEDDFGDEEVIDVETGEYVVETWDENFQDRKCNTCGHAESRRTNARVS